MQRIQNHRQYKKTSDSERLLICNNIVVRLVDYRWNQLYPSLRLMYEKLVKFGVTHDGKTVNF